MKNTAALAEVKQSPEPYDGAVGGMNATDELIFAYLTLMQGESSAHDRRKQPDSEPARPQRPLSTSVGTAG
jgi:hypothetical protein